MPATKDQKVKAEFAKFNKHKKSIRYSLKNPKGDYSDVTLLMIKLSNAKELAFYTTLRFTRFHSANYYLKLYAKRWNIETGYRLQKQFLPKTTCVLGNVRYLYFCYATAMHNLWLLLRTQLRKTFKLTVAMIKFILTYFWITTHINPDW